MKVTLIAYGIAKDILEGREKKIDLPDHSSIGELRSLLTQNYPQFSKLSSLSFAVGEEYKKDDFELSEDCEVVLIPPVSGG